MTAQPTLHPAVAPRLD